MFVTADGRVKVLDFGLAQLLAVEGAGSQGGDGGDDLLASLRAFTNLRIVDDPAAATGYKLDVGPFPGWKDVPTW